MNSDDDDDDDLLLDFLFFTNILRFFAAFRIDLIESGIEIGLAFVSILAFVYDCTFCCSASVVFVGRKTAIVGIDFSSFYSCLIELFDQVRKIPDYAIACDADHHNLISSSLSPLIFKTCPLINLCWMNSSAPQSCFWFIPAHFWSSFYYDSFYHGVYFRNLSCSNCCYCNWMCCWNYCCC